MVKKLLDLFDWAVGRTPLLEDYLADCSRLPTVVAAVAGRQQMVGCSVVEMTAEVKGSVYLGTPPAVHQADYSRLAVVKQPETERLAPLEMYEPREHWIHWFLLESETRYQS